MSGNLEPTSKNNNTPTILQRVADKMPSKKAARNAGIALAVTAAAVGVFLAYMHFSGMGISKAGFAQLGQQIGSTAKLAGKEIGKLAARVWDSTPGKVAIVSSGTFLAGVGAGAGALKYAQYRQAKRLELEQ